MTTKYSGIIDETPNTANGYESQPPVQRDPYYDGIVDKTKKKVKKVLCSSIKKHVMNKSQQVPTMERVLNLLLDEAEEENFCASEKSYYQSFKGLMGFGGKTKKYGKRHSKTTRRNKRKNKTNKNKHKK